ncbi:MAG TPA: branched-chain amino acid ABC transporter permease [Streptosporangiaceae bacterium]|jgi:neutral amino acid transport system permease protein|nr:branched-chain amino acid ABC transporter permease [Streptosporangiaceae bacterium]
MTTFLVTVGVGLATAAILALSAVAFTLQYAVSRVVNFAHGEFLTIGAYVAYSTQAAFHQNVAVGAVVAAAAGAAAGLVLNIAVIERFRGRTAITVLIATLGVALIAENVLEMIYGAANVSYGYPQGGLHHVGPFLWTTSDIEVIVAALAVAGLIYLLLQRTRFGKAIRAVSQDRALAQVSGIPARRIILQTWILAGAVAGFAGFALADTVGTFGPLLGFNFLLLTITATVAGGLGRPYGTLGGALIVGLVIQIAGTYTDSAYELVFAFLLLVVLMLFRPNGVFVRRSAVAVRA